MDQCTHCQSSSLARTQVAETIEAAGHIFSATVDALKCENCGEVYLDGASLERAELTAAKMICDAGEVSGVSLRFMRKALGLQAQELAELLAVSVETMSKWERGHRGVDTHAWLVVAALVSDRIEDRTTTRDRLTATRSRSRLPKRVRLEDAPAADVVTEGGASSGGVEGLVAQRLTKVIRQQDYVAQMMFAKTRSAKEDLRERIRSGYVSELDPAGTGTLTRKKNAPEPTRPTMVDMQAVRGLLTRIETALVRNRWDAESSPSAGPESCFKRMAVCRVRNCPPWAERPARRFLR
jgi:putative zinc finger/helix-turn-helix YgiT family protein